MVKVACPDRSDGCYEVRLPERGYLDVPGQSPHLSGCRHLDDGVVQGSVDQRVVSLRMTRPSGGTGSGLCRALAVLNGRGVVGPLAAGAWILWPEGVMSRSQSPFSPLHLGAVRFAPSP